jgi:hypothetical protein
MAGSLLGKYGTSNQSITCTLTSLANAAQRQSTVVDNTTNLFTDALVQPIIKTGASGVSATGYIQLYVYGTANGGTNYSYGATGSDAAFTIPTNAALRPLGRIGVGANATTYNEVFSVAAAFGGSMPDHWGVIVDNETGAAFDGTTASLVYQGVYGSYT